MESYTSSKRSRDPRAPKRNLSAYLLYQNAMRDTFKAQNPGMTFGQLSKFTSSMYSQITAEEKKAWENRAEADKQRYIQELSAYVPPPGFDAKGDAVVAYNPVYMPNNAAEKPFYHAPKRCLPAYMLFQNAMRDQFRRDNPAMTFGELSSYTSQKYKLLTPDEKASWQQLAEADKARYEQEKTMFYPPYNQVTAPMTNKKSRSGKKPKAVKDRGAPKRARGAYVFFANNIRPLIMQQNPTIDFKEMGVLMGERWRSLTPEERAPYEAMALSDKERFKQEMVEYNSRDARAMIPETMASMHVMHAAMNPEVQYATEMAAYPNEFAHSLNQHGYAQNQHDYVQNQHDYVQNQHDYVQSINPEDYTQAYTMQSYGAASYDNLNPNNYYYDPYNYH